jgi:hypothetical protein
MMRTLQAALVAAAGILLSACASGPSYSEMKSSIPTLAQGQGRIYFYRSNSMMGAAVQPDISLNGQVVGSSQPGGFFYVDRPAGNYEAVCGTEVDRKATFVLDPGQERYIKTSISMGVMVAHVTPELVDPTEGSAAVQSLNYAPPKAAQQ